MLFKRFNGMFSNNSDRTYQFWLINVLNQSELIKGSYNLTYRNL